MKRKAEKADIVKRKVFHEHIILLTEGRFLMLAVLAVMVWLPYLFVRDRMAGMTLAWWEIPFLLLVEVSLYCVLLRQFWYRCFECLVVTEDEIVWKCSFMRTVRLKKAEIKYTGIDYRWSGSVGKAVTPVDVAYFSTKSYPQECRNKSYLLRNKKGFIKFPAGEKLCRYMSKWLSEPYERVFAAASDGYEARRRKKERKRIEKKMKMMK